LLVICDFVSVNGDIEFNHSVADLALDDQTFGTLFGRTDFVKHQDSEARAGGTDEQNSED
jgi:hypothetical protein